MRLKEAETGLPVTLGDGGGCEWGWVVSLPLALTIQQGIGSGVCAALLATVGEQLALWVVRAGRMCGSHQLTEVTRKLQCCCSSSYEDEQILEGISRPQSRTTLQG